MQPDLCPRHLDISSIRVLTLNVFGPDESWNRRRPILERGIREMDPHLIAFQETVVDEGVDQAAALVDANYHIVHSCERDGNGMGVSVASRWPIASVDELDLKVSLRTSAFPCTTLIAEIQAPEPFGPLLLANHFPDYQPNHEFERELQTVVAARHLEDCAGEDDMHVILAGDLDADAEAASVRFLSGRQSLGGMSVCYRDAWESVHSGEPGHTFTPRNDLMAAANWDWPFKRIDHVLVRCGAGGQPTLRIDACDLAFDRPIDGVWASDHFGLTADLALPPIAT